MITVRQEFLLKSIRRSSKGMTVEELCEKLKVSERTFREDMKQLQSFLTKYKVEIHYSSKDGYYFIKQEDKKVVQKIIVENEALFDCIPKESKEREFYILFEILWSSEYLVMEELAEKIYISKAAIAKDIKRVAEWIEEVIGESVEILKGKGIRLVTTEKNRRKMISSAIYRYYETDCKYLMKIFYHYEIGPNAKQYKSLNKALLLFFGQRKIVLDEESFLTLALEIMAYVRRIKDGFYIEDKATKYFSKECFQKLPFNEIEQIFQVSLVEKEKAFLIDIYRKKNFLSMEIEEKSELAETIFEEFRNKVKEKYQIDIPLENHELINKWKKHISSMIYRNQLAYQVDQYLANDLIKEYSKSYEIVKCMGNIVKEKADIEMTKIDYACQALYLEAIMSSILHEVKIAIVSNNSYIIIEEMKRRIQNNFSRKAKVIYVYSVSQFPQIEKEKEKPDLILATHLVKDKCDIPIIFVSNILKDDIDKIDEFISNFEFYNTDENRY